MSRQTPPPAILFTAAYQLLLGLIWFTMAFDTGVVFYRLFIASIAISFWITAAGLYTMSEWGRQKAVQLAVFDIISVVLQLAGGLPPTPLTILRLGMPLYTLGALNEPELRQRFS